MTLPNLLSALRLVLVVPLIFKLHNSEYGMALVILIIAGISDLLDGFLARTFNWRSRLGSFLDPIADKLLVLALILSLVFIGELPVWLFVIILLRDCQLTIGFVLLYFSDKSASGFLQPLITGKIAVASQIIAGVLVLLNLHFAWGWNLLAAFIVCGVLTAISDFHYALYPILAKCDREKIWRQFVSKQ